MQMHVQVRPSPAQPPAVQRGAALWLALALLLALAGPAAAPAFAASQAITSPGPLTRVEISDQLNCAVNHQADTASEFFGDTACGTLLAVGGTLFGPTDIPAGGGASPRTPFTPVSQTPVSGAGTAADPYRIVTVVDAGAGLRITQTDSYVVGQESYRTDVEVANTGGAAAAAILYRAGDCYLQNSDQGFGRVDPATGAVACVAVADPAAPTPTPGERIEQWLPLSAGSSFYEAHYSEVWTAIGAQQPFPNTCECDEYQDNGAGLSWNLDIPAGGSALRSHLTTFSPLGQVPLGTAKTADRGQSEPGATNGYTITVSNPNDEAVALDTVFDALPAGFSYVPGSSTGLTTDDPQVSGQTLTWEGPGSVPANGEASLHFEVTVATQPGTYLNDAGATAAAFAVTPADDTAAVTVGEGTPAPGEPTERIRGVSRIETAVEVSQHSFPETGTATVVLARSDTYPDALAGAPLAHSVDGPILLTNPGSLHPATRDEINRLGATTAIMLGGEQALSPQVASELVSQTSADTVERIAGVNRFDTAARTADRVGGNAVYVADGFDVSSRGGWPDALAASSLAAFQARPILLVDTDSLPSFTRDWIRDNGPVSATIAGGPVAVSEQVAAQIRAEGPTVERIFGATRYETARELADAAVAAGMSPQPTYVASGENFPDALVTGPAAAKRQGVLVLVHPSDLDNSPPTRQYLEQFETQIQDVFLLGGPGAISDAVEQQIQAILAE